MKPLGQFKTVREAIDEAQKRGLDEDRAVILNMDGDDQRSVKEWRENSN